MRCPAMISGYYRTFGEFAWRKCPGFSKTCRMAVAEVGVANRILAAGGLVARETGAGREYLLVHRRRYGDWCLPKGKLKSGETRKQAALREVREETGYAVEIVSFLGEVRYEVEGVPKIVRFWNMRLLGDSQGFIDPEEIVEAVWMPGDQALPRLDYPLEKELLRRAIMH